jgi:nucleoside-diphosphate-sugar epimerase
VTRLAAVTGATGFLGQHLVRALSDDGWRVRILARRDPISPFWSGLTPEVVIGGLSDTPALHRLASGADLVIHAAGLVAGRSSDFQRVNVEGSRAIARVVAAEPETRLLQVSSLAAREPQLSAYAASKRDGETAVDAILGPRAAIVRPPAIYGPGDREGLRLFATAASSSILPVLNPAARMALVHVEDAARQIAHLAQNPQSGPVALCDARPEGYAWSEIMGCAAVAVGRNARLIRIPARSLHVAAAIVTLDMLWRKRNSVLTFGKVRELSHSDWAVSLSECASSTPTPRFDISSGFRQTVDWYRSQGWL